MIPELKQLLDQKLMTIPGLKVLDVPPNSLTRASLPTAFVVYTGGRFSNAAMGLRRADVKFSIYLLTDFVAQERSSNRIPYAMELFDMVLQAFLDDPDLGGQVDHISAIQDSKGYVVVPVGGMDMFGFQLELEVVHKW
jgi:hypothetical protein